MKRTCTTIFYIGLGEERVCGQPATHALDGGRSYRCKECAKFCHPTRVSRLPKVAPKKKRAQA